MMSAKQLLLLNRSEVKRTLDWQTLLEACRSALIDVAAPHPLPAISAQLPVSGASLHLKAGAVQTPPTISVKANLRPDGGSADGVIVAFDYREQRVSAILASTDLTAMRTAAIAAIAYQALNRVASPKVAVLGAGPLAAYFVEVLADIDPAAEVRIWSRHFEHAVSLAEGRGSACAAVDDAIAGADVIVTCTPAREPLVQVGALGASTLILAMGADSPGKRELGPGILESSQVYADVLEQALSVGELAHVDAAIAQRAQPLGALLAANERASSGGRIVFDSVGSSTVDAAVVAVAMQRAVALGLGTEFAMQA